MHTPRCIYLCTVVLVLLLIDCILALPVPLEFAVFPSVTGDIDIDSLLRVRPDLCAKSPTLSFRSCRTTFIIQNHVMNDLQYVCRVMPLVSQRVWTDRIAVSIRSFALGSHHAATSCGISSANATRLNPKHPSGLHLSQSSAREER